MSIQTKYIQIATPAAVQDQELLEAAQIIRDGGLVAFPTETVYGLGANALDEKAAKKIYEAKGRPSDNPLIAHISCYEELEPLVTGIPQAGGKLARRYWPGPLTMVFPKSPAVPYGTTGGLDTVAVRMPSDPVASRLIALAGVPVAAPSANLSGRPSPTTARHVWQDMNGRINMILDGGPVGIGLESTIVDVSGPLPVLLRPGAITLEMLRDTVGKVEVDPAIQGPPAEGLRPKAPGMKYRHYAPRGELTLVEGESRAVVSAIRRLVEEGLAEGRKVAVICTEETRDQYSGGILRCVGTRTRQETIAHNLFAVLRELDDLGAEIIYSESFSQDHLGRAVMNRLMKAAGYRVIQV
ncbi:MAG: threonylcarbamoyl-AMP synthase [Lachnospiraceae bacterium]|jgi:L-threonylcarbamoyladenylate synthase|nr:threonylcarbamoyl-AMP synthase [Lachnospiraceae bacterium]